MRQQQQDLTDRVASLIYHESASLNEIASESLARRIIRMVRRAGAGMTQKPRCAVCGKEQARWMWLPHGLRPGNTFALPECCLPIGYKCKGVLEAGQPLAYVMAGRSYVANQPKGGN